MTIKKSWYKRIRMYIVFVLVVAGIFFYFNSKNKVTALVKKVSIENRVVKSTVSASGSVKSKKEADMSFAISAQLTNIYVKEGQKVNSWQILASVDNRGLVQTAKYYKDVLDIAKREKELFLQNEDSNKSLYHGEEGYNIKLREYQEDISKAEANYQVQLANLSKSSIYAPFSGTVIEITKKVGEMATASETIVKVADVDNVYFEISVDQTDFGSIKIDQEVELAFDSYPEVSVPGRVVELPAQANSSDSSFTVKITIEKPKELDLKIGMTGDAYMTTKTSTIEVPSLIYSDVQKDESGTAFLWVVENGKIKKEYPEIGIEGDIYTEIKSDVNKQIVIPAADSAKIQEGYTAKIIN